MRREMSHQCRGHGKTARIIDNASIGLRTVSCNGFALSFHHGCIVKRGQPSRNRTVAEPSPYGERPERDCKRFCNVARKQSCRFMITMRIAAPGRPDGSRLPAVCKGDNPAENGAIVPAISIRQMHSQHVDLGRGYEYFQRVRKLRGAKGNKPIPLIVRGIGVRAFAVGQQDDRNFPQAICGGRHGHSATEGLVVRMWRNDQNCALRSYRLDIDGRRASGCLED